MFQMMTASVWGIYYKAKRLTNNIGFIENSSYFTLRNFYLLFVIGTILQAALLFYIAYLSLGLLSGSEGSALFSNEYIMLTYQLLFESDTAITLLLIFYLAFVIYTTAVRTLKYQETDQPFLKFYRLDGRCIFLVSFIEETVWELRNCVAYILPAAGAYLMVIHQAGFAEVLSLSSGILVSLFFGILITLSIMKLYNKMIRQHFVLDYFFVLSFKMAVFMIILYFFSYFGPWFNQMPLQQKDALPSAFGTWLDEGFAAFQVLTEKLSFVVPEKGNLLLFLGVYALIAAGSMLAGRAWLDRGNAEAYFLKSFVSREYTKIHFKYFSGSMLMWMNNGLIFGLLVYSSNEKVQFFLLMSLINYSFFYYLFTNMDDFSYLYLLDGEGKRVVFWKAGNMIRLFNMKMLFHSAFAFLSFLPFLILFFLLGDLPILYLFLSMGYVMILTVFYFIVTACTTLIAPYFNYENLFELKEQAIRKRLYSMINAAFFIIVLPSLLWPFALYFAGDFTKDAFVFYSFILIPLLLISIIAVMKFVLNRKIASDIFQLKIFGDM
ncbi:hypothetical protein M4S82_10670 [Planococcus sp. MERTA32b]|nr:hypothetical protein [Planococcus sp. MER TA 32b]